MRTAVLTISTTLARGEGDDRSGDELVRLAEEAGCELVAREVVSDDAEAIATALRAQVAADAALVFTTGGTGLTPDDVTPEATRAVIEREAPGITEAMRAVSREHTPMAVLSRAVAGIRGATLIVNFPGSPKAVEECFGVLELVLPHAVRTLRGESRHGH